VIPTPFQAPQANAYAERFVRTECLDWLLILGPHQLDRVMRVFFEHYNSERPHRALGRCPPTPAQPTRPPPADGAIKRRDRLGGLAHEYYRAAA
jgi:putative transposase